MWAVESFVAGPVTKKQVRALASRLVREVKKRGGVNLRSIPCVPYGAVDHKKLLLPLHKGKVRAVTQYIISRDAGRLRCDCLADHAS